MSGEKKTFLLPCAGCACEIEVVAGQAGGQVECRSCGRRNDVPKFRDLGQLRIKSQVVSSQASWGLAQAVALAGVACATLAWGAAAWVGSVPTAAFDSNQIRANIEAGDDAALDRPPMVGEVLLQRQSLFVQGISRTLYAIGGLGALAAIAAGLAMLTGTKRA
jgi:hypothetical protein